MDLAFLPNEDSFTGSIYKSNPTLLSLEGSIFNNNDNNNNFLFLKDKDFISIDENENEYLEKNSTVFYKNQNNFDIDNINDSSYNLNNLNNNPKEENNDSFFFNDIFDAKINDQFTPISLLTTSNSNPINTLKKENNEFSFESTIIQNPNNNFNDTTSLPYAIIQLMSKMGPLDINTIVSSLEYKKNIFRKENGSRYKNDFYKVIKSTLNTSGIFYKIDEIEYNIDKSSNKNMNKYYFIKDKEKFFLEKKRKREMDKILFNIKKKNEIIPTKIKIQLDKVNSIIKKLEKKYRGDNKYFQVTFCIDMFKNLIKKYLFLIKKDKNNSLYDLAVLNEKIMDICQSIEKLEKNEIFEPKSEVIIKTINEYNKENKKNIMLPDGVNNIFTEPPEIDNQD